MADRPARSNRVTTFTLSTDADLDLSATYNYTVSVWDIDQAENYAQLLKTIMQELAAYPEVGSP